MVDGLAMVEMVALLAVVGLVTVDWAVGVVAVQVGKGDE